MSTYLEENGFEHPLFDDRLEYIISWEEWKKLWDETQLAEFRHSLLFVGFNVSTKSLAEDGERLCRYLSLADGHNEASPPWKKWSNPNHSSSFDTPLGKCKDRGELLRIISEKAFRELCEYFFKEEWKGDKVKSPSWVYLVSQIRVFEKIVWFFRVHEEGTMNLRRCKDTHHGQVAESFARGVCRFAFEFNSVGVVPTVSDDNIKAFLKSSWPKLIPLVCALGETQLLFRHHPELSDECLNILEGLALGHELWNLGRSRKVTSVEEACYAGSNPAHTLILLRVLRKEHNRLLEIEELESVIRETEQQINVLKVQ